MKRRSWVIIAVLAVVIVMAALSWNSGPHEPVYDGRSLIFWLDEWSESNYTPTSVPAVAIRAIGTNGLPFLMDCLAEAESPVQKVRRFTWKFLPESFIPESPDTSRMLAAACAVNLLGPESRSAFPALTNLMTNKAHVMMAGIALAGMGSEGIDVLLSALTNKNWYVRDPAAHALGHARSDFDKVIPALVETAKRGGTNQNDSDSRVVAVIALMELHQEPERIVPFFSDLLTNSDPNVRLMSATLLTELGTNATSAIPALRKAEKDSDPDVREAAQNTLKRIDPNPAAQ